MNRLHYLFIVTSMFLAFFSCNQKKDATPNNPIVKKDSLSIMSFNIRYDNPDDGIHAWNNRKEACATMINEIRPDAFGVQEALDNQLKDLETLLPEYAKVGKGRNPESDSNEYAAIFYLKNKYELIDSSTFWLSQTPEIVSRGWDAKYNRVATWIHLKDKSSSKEFLFLNTHLDHKGKIARTESTKLIVNQLEKLGHDSIAVFVSGDFNALPSDSLLIPIKSYMQDTRMVVNPADSTQTTNGWGNEPKYKVIDYIFFRNADAIGYKVITKDFGVPFISDHYPIVGTFKY